MLITNVEEKKEWVKTFNRKFAHFARNAPILLSFDSSDWKSVEITAYTPHRQTLSFEMDFEMDVSTFISRIREEIKKLYPVILHRWEERRDLSSEEITKVMMDEDISFDEALNRSAVEKHETYYRIDKVFNDSNSVVLTNMGTGKSVRYQVSIPVAYLVDRIIYDESNTTAANILMQNATPISTRSL